MNPYVELKKNQSVEIRNDNFYGDTVVIITFDAWKRMLRKESSLNGCDSTLNNLSPKMFDSISDVSGELFRKRYFVVDNNEHTFPIMKYADVPQVATKNNLSLNHDIIDLTVSSFNINSSGNEVAHQYPFRYVASWNRDFQITEYDYQAGDLNTTIKIGGESNKDAMMVSVSWINDRSNPPYWSWNSPLPPFISDIINPACLLFESNPVCVAANCEIPENNSPIKFLLPNSEFPGAQSNNPLSEKKVIYPARNLILNYCNNTLHIPLKGSNKK